MTYRKFIQTVQVTPPTPAVQVTPPTEEDEFYTAWGLETLKNNLVFTNEVLRQLVTLNVALLGGSIVFLDKSLINTTYRTLTIISFLVSLSFSFFGMMPYQGEIDLRVPKSIKKHKERAFRHKRCYLWIAGVFLAIGFIIALIGMIMYQH